MNQYNLQTPLVVLAVCVVGCASPHLASSSDPLAAPFVRDVVTPPPNGGSLQDLAFTFPVFEMGAEQTKLTIDRGDFHVITTDRKWLLEGDGAQPSILLERTSPDDVTPIRVRLEVGGIEDDPSTVYMYERVEGGWRSMK